MTTREDGRNSATIVLHTGNLHWATEELVVERTLQRRPGVLAVDANAVSQTANVRFDPDVTSVADLRRWVEECGMHCAGASVPHHVCDPMEEPAAEAAAPRSEGHPAHMAHHGAPVTDDASPSCCWGTSVPTGIGSPRKARPRSSWRSTVTLRV